jgi:hypothetical protein
MNTLSDIQALFNPLGLPLNILQFSSYLTGNTSRPCYKAQQVSIIQIKKSMFIVRSTRTHETHEYTGGGNAEFYYDKPGGTYENHWAVNA